MKSLTRTTLAALAAITLLGAISVAAAQQPFVTRQTTYIVRFASAIDESDAPVLLRQPITLHLRKVSLERALQEIASRAGAPLSYSRAVVPLDRVVSIDVRDGSVLQAFYEVLGNVNVELWVSTDGHMALVPAVVAAGPAEIAGIIAGRVTIAGTSEPVTDATISVSGTRLRASTGSDGTYSVTGVPEGAHTVYVQRIGFTRDSAAVVVTTNQTVTANFSLRALAVSLNEVVT
ncbi:MAG TPA: carboxypeptidase-like regulatory domain-containing protein, partial [Gemmatimonadaceae bacterium]|nr:carboxypeptidase-like regulatory domain-containing protein [Gemmatimonadaceae bacterium]